MAGLATDTATAERPGDDRTLLDSDHRLVLRCLSGEEDAWDELYRDHHPSLLRAISCLLGADAANSQLHDELAARVWFALVRKDARVLRRYADQRHARLSTFLGGLARIEVLRYFRAEHRRRHYERMGGRQAVDRERIDEPQFNLMINEFSARLTAGEKAFFDSDLMAPVRQADERSHQDLSSSNVWQRRHRIRAKLQDYLRE